MELESQVEEDCEEKFRDDVIECSDESVPEDWSVFCDVSCDVSWDDACDE